MNPIVKTQRSVPTVCTMLYVLMFAAFVDTASLRLVSINFVSMNCI